MTGPMLRAPAGRSRRLRLAALVLTGTILGLFLTVNWRDAGSSHSWIWYPMGIEHGAIDEVPRLGASGHDRD